MRKYDYSQKWKKLLTPDIVLLLTKIHECKGEQTLFIESHADELMELVEKAKLQSIEASNKMEGIYTSAERLKKIVQNKTMPKTGDELEIAGYRDVLNIIHDSHEHIPPKPSIILQLHRDLCKYEGQESGGYYKNTDDVIAKGDIGWNEKIHFQPVSVGEIAKSVENLCKVYEEIIGSDQADPLLIMPMFIVDFLCIHPFNHGNGRMSRLLMLLLLYRSGYMIGKYISIEKLIEMSKETYYEALKLSSVNWHENENNYEPFVKYTLGIVVNAYREFFSKVKVVTMRGMSKPDRIREIMKETIGKITKTEIMQKCPDISQVTVQRTLTELQNSGEILKIGGGRYTAYVWNREDE